MHKNFTYPIQHFNIRNLLHNGFEPIHATNKYCVYWWNEIPLGHCWNDEIDKSNKQIPERLIWNVVHDSLRFYCSQQKSINFDDLKSSWHHHDYTYCSTLLEKLFLYPSQSDNSVAADVSLVICTRNRPLQLKNCLDSLVGLSLQPAEVIVVDNAPDNNETKEIVSECPHVKYVLEERKGLDIARNTGWQNAISPIIAYTDDDVRLHKDWIKQIAVAFNHPRVQAVTGLVLAEEINTEAQYIFEKYWSFNRGYCHIYYNTDYFKKHIKKGVPAWDVGAGANMAFRRSILQSTGGFDPRLDVGAAGCSGDSEMWYRLLAEGWTIHYSPGTIAYHQHRKEKRDLKRQIYFYMRGAATSLLIQHQRYRHRGNLYHLYRRLPAHYFFSLLMKVRYPAALNYSTLTQEVTGCIAGIFYFLLHKKYLPPHYADTFAGNNESNPLVSVIITTYNHAKYLPDSMNSVSIQTYKKREIIVVDDGSIDDTEKIVAGYPQVRYIKQENKGLAAARNTGIFNSNGDFIVFLDADDLLYPHALSENLKHFDRHPECAFISGWHDRVNENKELIETYESSQPDRDHYNALLQGNYIGMHAAVMYRREILHHFLFDETLPACEDYDLYLRIAKNNPVFSHAERLAAYRIHHHNMSNNVSLMLSEAKETLSKNYLPLKEKESKPYFLRGKKNWRRYYAREIYKHIGYPHYKLSVADGKIVLANLPLPLFKLFLHKTINKSRRFLQKNILAMKERVRRILGKGYKTLVPPLGKIRMGDMRRTIPLSREFGYDRGGPVDRYYIENFLLDNAIHIKGNVLEVGDNAYTHAYGKEKVIKSDVLHIDASNPGATIVGDLSHADHVASEQFDCIVLTQTLHLIYDFKAAIYHCHRLLKHGGVLLMTVPGISQIDYGEWGNTWYWSFTGKAIQKLLSEYFNPADTLVQTYGNVLAASAFLYGMGQHEITDKEKNENDPHYQVIITAKAIKN